LDKGINNWILKFAADAKIFSRIKDVKDSERLQNYLLTLTTWSDEWRMMINVSKCKVMHVGKAQVQHHYYMNSQQL